jgi:hypothetical protein
MSSLSFVFYGVFGGKETDFGVRPVTEWLICGCATAAERDRLFPADIYFFAISISDFQLTQVSAKNVRAGLFDQDIDCHSVSSNNFYVETI